MSISAHRKHKIYIAAIMGYGLGSDDLEELSYYNEVQEKMLVDIEKVNFGVVRED